MRNKEKLLHDLKVITSKVEQTLLSDEQKISFGDYLRLLQHRGLQVDCNRPIHIQAGWVSGKKKPA